MSLSAGGATTTTLTPSSLPFASAPAWTAAQNGLPEPGPFIATITVSAARAPNATAPSRLATSNSIFLITFSRLCFRAPTAKTSRQTQEPVPQTRLRMLLGPHRCATSQDVDVDSENDDDSNQQLLPENTDVHQVQAVAQKPHDEHAREYAEHRAAPAEEAGAADDHGGDRIKLCADSGVGKARIGAAREQERGQPGEEARHHINEEQNPLDADAAHARSLRISTDRIDVTTDGDLSEKQCNAAVADEQHERADRNGTKGPQPRQRNLCRAEKADRGGQSGDGPPIRDQIGQPAHRVERAERHDERVRQAQQRQAKAVDRADDDSYHRPDQ